MSTVAVVAGEASGDIHAANLVRALRRLRPALKVWGVGGAALRGAGADVGWHTESVSGMGLVEVAAKVPAVLRVWREVRTRFRKAPPDLFLPVDFGGLNLRLARAAREARVPVVYYIPPKVWAWGRGRVKRLRRDVNEALVILPFEEAFLRARGVNARYVGSPVLDHLAPPRFSEEADLVGLLPGSREGEVTRIWPLLLRVAALLSRDRALRFAVPLAPGLPRELLEAPLGRAPVPVSIETRPAQEVMERARVCVVASGTATLECALVGTPMVVVYRVSALTYAAGRTLLSVPFIALPNLIAGRSVVPEFVQTGPEEVARRAAALLDEGPARKAAQAGLAEVRRAVGAPGASERAARRVLAWLPPAG